MTKGKYAVRAARRREDESVQSEISAYQHHVRRLTGEIRELTGTLAAERAARKEETRRLRAMLDEGLSPELIALREELEQQRQRAGQAEARTRRVQDRNKNRVRTVFDLLCNGLGLTPVEAYELMLTLDPDFMEGVHDDQRYAAMMIDRVGTHPGKLTLEQVHGVQAARGTRHGADVVKLLRDKVDAARAGQPE